MAVKRTRFFKSKQTALRPSQKKALNKAVQTIIEKPKIGNPGEEEIEGYFFYDYSDNFGKMRISYTLFQTEEKADNILLISLSRISIKI